MSNRLALRLALFGGFALVLFAILFFRLWQLQVLSGEEYLAEAKNNRTREFRVERPTRRNPRPQRQRPGWQPNQPCPSGQPAEIAGG